MTTIIGAAGSLIIILLWIFILNEIILFGAEISKVYATTIGPHPQLHLSGRVEKILTSLEEAEERIERTTGKVVEAPEKKIEKVQTKEVVEKPSEQIAGEELEIKAKETVENSQDNEESENVDEGSVEVSVKIKTPKKKKYRQDLFPVPSTLFA